MEAIGYISFAVLFVLIVLKLYQNATEKDSYYEDTLRTLGNKSPTFKARSNILLSNGTRSEVKRLVNEGLNDPIIQEEIKRHDDNIKKREARYQEMNWYVYNNIDEILLMFNGKTFLTEEELYSKMQQTYSSKTAIDKKIEEYKKYIIRKTDNNLYAIAVDRIHHPTSADYKSSVIEIKDYKNEEKRRVFRNQ